MTGRTRFPQLTNKERAALKALTPRGRHRDVWFAVEGQCGWDASTPIKRLLELKLIKRIGRGEYKAVTP
jgi:hypothetical protein